MKFLKKYKNYAYRFRIRELKTIILWTIMILVASAYLIQELTKSKYPYLILVFAILIILMFYLMRYYQKMITKWLYNIWISRFYICLRILIMMVLTMCVLVTNDKLGENEPFVIISISFGLIVLYFMLYSMVAIPYSEYSTEGKNKFQIFNNIIREKLSVYLVVQLSKELAVFISLIFIPCIGMVLYSRGGVSYGLLLTSLMIFLVLICLVLTIPREKKDNVLITFLNLDVIDIFQNDIYINEYWQGRKDCRIFKIEFKNAFENLFKHFSDNSKYCITILDNFCMPARIQKKQESTYAYFCMNTIYKPTTVKLNVLLTNRNLNQKRNSYIKLNLIIQFDRIGDEIVLQKYEIHNLHKIIFAFNNGRKYGREEKCKEYDFLFRCYQYNNEMFDHKENEFKNLTIDKRKMVLHNGPFGSGKTSLDILLLSNYNYYPVVVSPWEDNYDNDILFLIFQQLMKSTNYKVTWPTTTVMFFFMTAVFSLTAFIVNVIENLVELSVDYKVISMDILNIFAFRFVYSGYEFDIGTIFIYLVSFFISLYFSSILLPYIIIHVKDSSKVHQNFYINKISSILRRGKQVLVIEDVDRLEPEVANNVFRIISSINKGCASSQRIVGIISLNKDLFVKVKKDESKLDAKKLFEDLENKVIKKEVFTEYKEKESKIKYFHECIYASLGYCLWKNVNYSSLPWSKAFVKYVISQVYPTSYKLIINLKIRKDNFRTVHDHLETIKDYIEGNREIRDVDLSKLIKKIK